VLLKWVSLQAGHGRDLGIAGLQDLICHIGFKSRRIVDDSVRGIKRVCYACHVLQAKYLVSRTERTYRVEMNYILNRRQSCCGTMFQFE